MSNKLDNSLKQISNQFFCVFNDNGANVFKSSRHIYSKLCNEMHNIGFIALIQHENEWDEENKRVKTNHYHVYFNLRYCLRCSLNSMLNYLVDIFHCNKNQISIEKATDESMCVRYLCHLDNMDKQSYMTFDVITNNMLKCDKYFEKIPVVSNEEEFFGICDKYKWSSREIILKIGMKNWTKFSKIYYDVKRDLYLR